MGKPRGLKTARKHVKNRRSQVWADLDYKKAHLGTRWKANPFGGASHAKGIVLEKVGTMRPDFLANLSLIGETLDAAIVQCYIVNVVPSRNACYLWDKLFFKDFLRKSMRSLIRPEIFKLSVSSVTDVHVKIYL